jgi:2-dehydropantoate 2-reductase
MVAPRVVILGTGSLGIVLGAFLDKSGAEIVCVCRSNYQAAKAQGFKVNSTVLGSYVYHPKLVHSVPEARALADQPFDYIVVATKAFPDEHPSPVEIISEAVSTAHTAIVLVQNGIGIEEAYRKKYPANLIITAVAYMPSTRVSSIEVVQTETQRILTGAYPSRPAVGTERDSMRKFQGLLSAGGAQAEIHADIQVERWKKLIGNATWNPICALSRCCDVELLGTSDIAGSFVAAAMHEIVAVARAIGYGDQVNEEVVKAQIRRSAVRPAPGVQPSMMADMLQGSKMEVEVIVGEVVRLARENGVAVPRLETLYVLASGLNWSLSQRRSSR